jgi:hypothetical protein
MFSCRASQLFTRKETARLWFAMLDHKGAIATTSTAPATVLHGSSLIKIASNALALGRSVTRIRLISSR